MDNNELYHYGVKGMKWGKRKLRGHAGPGVRLTPKRQSAGDKRDLEELKKGQHLSVGFTKKRQARYDARDKAALEKRIAKSSDKTSNAKRIEKGAKIARKVIMANTIDSVFFDGAGKKAAKKAVIQTGRAAVTAYTVARGGYDIRWYDK